MTKPEILQKLTSIRNDADAINKLFENGRVPAAKVPQAQALFKRLKERLQSEYRRMATVKGQAALCEAERFFYKPAIDDAWANTVLGPVRWNSRPDKEWHDALWNISDYMDYWSSSLKKAEANV